MKLRKKLVSNSSSSSFIPAARKKELTPLYRVKILNHGFQYPGLIRDNQHIFLEEGFTQAYIDLMIQQGKKPWKDDWTEGVLLKEFYHPEAWDPETINPGVTIGVISIEPREPNKEEKILIVMHPKGYTKIEEEKLPTTPKQPLRTRIDIILNNINRRE